MNKKNIIFIIVILLAITVCIFVFEMPATHSKPHIKPKSKTFLSHKTISAENPYLQKMLAEYEKGIREIMASSKTPGAAIVVVKDSSIIYMKGFGVKVTGTSDSVDTQTVFRLGSVSKCFAPVLTGMLIQDGVLSWNDKVIRYLPDFALKSKEQTDLLTLTNVLSHTVGLPYHTYTNLVEENTPLPAMMYRLREIDMIGNVGTVYSYQNVAYSIIAEVIKSATGKSYEQLMTERIFKPLQMNNASISYKEIMKNPNVAKPHSHTRSSVAVGKISDTYYNVAPAGGVNASIADMAEWTLAMLGNRKDIVTTKTLNQIFKPVIKARSKNRNFRKIAQPTGSFYAMGWRELEYKTDTLYYHGGYVNGYRSELALDRHDKIGICILTNATGELADTSTPYFFNLYFTQRDSIQSWENHHRLTARSK